MASKFLGVLCLLAIATRAMAGVATYAHSPYAAYHVPTAAAAVYHAHPLAYHAASPYFARSGIVATAPAAYSAYSSPIVRTYAAAPLAAVSPVVKSYAGPAVAAVSPYVRTYAAPAVAPVYANSALVAAPAAAVVKSVAPAAVVAAPAPAVVAAAPAAAVLKTVDYDSAPRYDFSYGVHDSLTGDIKNQVESRNGGNVAGSYSVVDADGYKRTVTYTADDLNGFNAVVQREPIVRVAAAVAAPVVPAAVATPIHHIPVQQQLEYLPAQQQIQQEYLPQAPAVPVQQEPASEPIPVEYPEQQQQPQLPVQQYPQDQDYPPFSQGSNNGNNEASNDDSDVVEVRSAKNTASAATPAPVTENQKDSLPPKRTA